MLPGPHGYTLAMDLTADAVAAYVFSGKEPIEPLLERLEAEPKTARTVLDELARNRTVEVRAWAVWAAPKVLGSDAVPLLKRLTEDEHPDVRDEALRELVELDPDAARSLIPLLRRKLRSDDIWEPVVAMWALAAVDPDAGDAIREAGERADEYPFHRLVADVVGLLIAGDAREIERRLRSHDHRSTAWLVKAARRLDDPQLNSAVEELARTLPCEECRGFCAGAR
jgi:hypothetical protein